MPDLVGQIYTHLADTMTASDSALKAVPIRKFVRFDGRDGFPDRIKGGPPGDSKGRVIFDLADLRDVAASQPNIPNTGSPFPTTFIQQAQERIRLQVATFRARIIMDDEGLLLTTAIVAAIYSDLLAAIDPTAGDGQDLGIEGCNSILLATSFRNVRTKNDQDAPDRLRRVGDLLIPVRVTYLQT